MSDRGFAIFRFEIPETWLEKAIENPDALDVAYDVGVLELLSISLTVFSVLLAVIGFLGFWSVRRSSIQAARKVALIKVPAAVNEYVRNDGFAAIREALREPETAAALQAIFEELGLNDAPTADAVEGTLWESFNARAS